MKTQEAHERTLNQVGSAKSEISATLSDFEISAKILFKHIPIYNVDVCETSMNLTPNLTNTGFSGPYIQAEQLERRRQALRLEFAGQLERSAEKVRACERTNMHGRRLLIVCFLLSLPLLPRFCSIAILFSLTHIYNPC